jgi:hypothetical protein
LSTCGAPSRLLSRRESGLDVVPSHLYNILRASTVVPTLLCRGVSMLFYSHNRVQCTAFYMCCSHPCVSFEHIALSLSSCLVEIGIVSLDLVASRLPSSNVASLVLQSPSSQPPVERSSSSPPVLDSFLRSLDTISDIRCISCLTEPIGCRCAHSKVTTLSTSNNARTT